VDEKISKLKNLLKRAEEEDPEDIKSEAKDFLKNMDETDLMVAEQGLIDDGMKPSDMRHLCTAHLELMREQWGSNPTNGLPSSHPVKVLMQEHEQILSLLEKLEKASSSVNTKGNSGTLDTSRENVRAIAESLLSAENHHLREEKALFPELEQRGLSGPPEIMRMEHETLRTMKHDLLDLTSEKDDLVFKKELSRLSADLIFMLRDHIFKEDNVLYPSAIDLIKNEEEWDSITQTCDKIGYCPFLVK